MTKSRVFVGGAVSFAVGIFCQSMFNWPIQAIYLLGGLAATLFAVTLYRSKKMVVATAWLLCVALGMVRMSKAVYPNQFVALLETKQQVDAIVVTDPDVRTDRQLLTVRPLGYGQNILVTTSKTQTYFYGDRLLIAGKVTEPKVSEDFDYRAYLWRWNTYALMQRPKVIILQHHQGNPVTRQLLVVKHVFIKQIKSVLSEVQSNLVLGILIGARKGLPEDVINNFNATGVSHIIAISGYNISIIAVSLGFLDKWLGRRINFWFTAIVILVFVIISGASASVTRAALMGGLVLVSTRVHRLYAITPALCAAAVGMLLLNPRILYWDASFQLSFLATAGVVYVAPLLESLTARWWGLWGIKSIFLTTMSAIIATLPLILYQFGRLSLVAPLVNIIILPFVPATMLFGFLSGLPFLGHGFGLLASWLLQYMLTITGRFAGLSYASAEVHIGQDWLVILYAVIIFSYLLLKRYDQSWHKTDPMIQ